MGKTLAEAALALGHEVCLVSGPVELAYPSAAEIISVRECMPDHPLNVALVFDHSHSKVSAGGLVFLTHDGFVFTII